MAPCAILRDTQPLRALAFDPAASLWVGDSASNSSRSVALAVGSNSHALRIARVSWQSFPPALVAPSLSPGGSHGHRDAGLDVETGLPLMTPVHTWSGHHNGSVYAASWAYADASCTDGLLASCSNDAKVHVARWRHYDTGGGGGGGPRDIGGPEPGAASLSLSPAVATVRDVCWIGVSPASGAPPLLAAAGGGDFGISVFDVSTAWSAWPGAPSGSDLNRGGMVAKGAPPVLRFLGHSGTVHGIEPWNHDGRTLLSASAGALAFPRTVPGERKHFCGFFFRFFLAYRRDLKNLGCSIW
jgi:hypothetical protein